jgi:hypothetical protein
MTETDSSELTARRLLLGLLAATSLLRLALGWRYFGFLTGDDVEILEAGFRALGLHYSPGAIRNTLLPDLFVAPVLVAAHALGVSSPRMLVWVASWPFVGSATLNIYLLHRLVRAWLPRPAPALAAAFLYGCHWLPLGFGTMPYPRTVSTSCVLAAALLASPALPASESARSGWREVLAGAAMALAFAIRYSEMVFLPAVGLMAVVTLAGAGWRAGALALSRLAAGFCAGALLLAGGYEAAIWGRPFAALLALVKFTVADRQTTSVAALHPFYWYLWRLPHWWCPAALPFAWAALRRRRLTWAWIFIVVPLTFLSAIQFKELRYLQGVIPFVCALSGAGAVEVWDAGWRRTAAVLFAVALLWGLWRTGFLARKSMPAVLAAEALAGDPAVHGFAGVQLWAFGDRLYLGDRRVLRDIPYPTSTADLGRLAPGADAVAVYTEDVAREPELGAALARLKLCPWRSFYFRGAKPVSVFRPCRP